MNILYVADNSDRLNWGCRGTSIALRELLAREHRIVGVASGKMVEARYPVSDKVSGPIFTKISRHLYRRKARKVPVLGPALMGTIESLGDPIGISHDLDQTLANIEKARAYSPAAQRLFDGFEKCDAVVVNGEGDLIFTTPARQTLLYTLAVCHLALKHGKPVYYVNAMVSPCPRTGINKETVELAASILSRCALFVVRDPASLDFVREHMPNVKATALPDALFSWRNRFMPVDITSPASIERFVPFFEGTGHAPPKVANGPYIAVSGSSLAARDQARARQSYGNLVRELKKLNIPLLLIPTCTGDAFMSQVAADTGEELLPLDTPILAGAAILANARAFVSGRWHPGIMAALGGTPSVFMGSNSHKTLAIQTQLGYEDPREFNAFPSPEDCVAITARTAALLAEGEARRQRGLDISRRLAAEAESCLDLIRQAA